jgi:hypothetical protein
VSDSFPTSRFIEKLKLGDKAQGAGKSSISLPLSFTEDRALTAVQLLLAEQSLGEIENLPMTPKAQEMWRWKKGYPFYTPPRLNIHERISSRNVANLRNSVRDEYPWRSD